MLLWQLTLCGTPQAPAVRAPRMHLPDMYTSLIPRTWKAQEGHGKHY